MNCWWCDYPLQQFLVMRTSKRNAENETPPESPAKGSPKKARTPPKKAKEAQILTFGQPCKIQYYRTAEFKLWHVVNLDDKSDAFVKNIVDLMRMNPDCALRILHAFRGDLARRISLTCDEVMRNHRKSYERKWLIQLIEIDTKEADIAAANEIYSVSKDVS